MFYFLRIKIESSTKGHYNVYRRHLFTKVSKRIAIVDVEYGVRYTLTPILPIDCSETTYLRKRLRKIAGINKTKTLVSIV